MLLLFSTSKRALRYLSVVLVGLPTWFVMGILVTFSPEIGKALGKAVVAGVGLELARLASGHMRKRLGVKDEDE